MRKKERKEGRKGGKEGRKEKKGDESRAIEEDERKEGKGKSEDTGKRATELGMEKSFASSYLHFLGEMRARNE